MQIVAEKLKQAVPEAFEGDGVAYMQSVYRDPSFSQELRLDAAAKAARFGERVPRAPAGGSPRKEITPMLAHRREKTFGPSHGVPLDRNAKCRIAAYARAWSARNRRPGQHHGPLTMAFERVLRALLWSFHNSRDGRCFPGYERIAEQARCAHSTVAEALKALEWAGVLTWQHRITRVRERCTDLFGNITWQWRVHRRSNAYVFRDPLQRASGYESETWRGTQNQSLIGSVHTPARDADSALERALARFGEAMAGREGATNKVGG